MIRLPLLSGLAVVLSMAASSHADEAGAHRKDLTDFLLLWSGTWSNDRQVFFAEDAGLDRSSMAPLQEVALNQDDKPVWVVGEAVYTVSTALKDGVIVQTFASDDGEAVCTARWRRSGAQFAGTGVDRGCTDLIAWGEDQLSGPVSMTLAETEMSLAVEPENGLRVEADFRRVRPFTCWVAVLRGASHGDSGQGMRDWDFRRGVELHDQGGVASVATDEEPPRTVRLRLRDVDWTYGERRPSLTLYVLGEDDRAISYAWTGGGSDRIGINLRWLQASCTRDGL